MTRCCGNMYNIVLFDPLLLTAINLIFIKDCLLAARECACVYVCIFIYVYWCIGGMTCGSGA